MAAIERTAGLPAGFLTTLEFRGANRPPLLAVALASAVALAYQVLLLRLFSIVQFHHTAYMVISLALLGYGASGTALTLWRKRWEPRFAGAFGLCLTLFGVTAVGCFALGQRIGVHPEELLWSPRQIVWLLVLYLLLAVPFFFIGAAVGAALMLFPATRVYAADLLGAGVGTGLVVALLWFLTPGGVLRIVAIAALAAAVVADYELERWSWRRLGALTVVAALVWSAPSGWVDPRPSEYKGLSQALRVHGAELADERSSPLALVSVVESREVPLRHAPGLSLAVPAEPAEQVGLFLDAESLVPIVRWQQGSERLAYLAYSTSALPYAIHDPERVLVLGAGGGEEVARARYFGVESVVGVEINRDVVALVRGKYDQFTDNLYDRSGVEIEIADIRGFVARESAADRREFDLVVLAAIAGYGGGGPALASLSEDYLLTAEAFDAYLDLVAPDGILTATVFLKNPPRDTVKLAATAIAALERRGVESPAERLAVIRSWQTATLVVKRGKLTQDELANVRAFSRERLFDAVYFPGMRAAEANRFNRLRGAAPHQAVTELLGPDREEFFSSYKFAVRPATDDRPFFHQFFRWRSLPEIVAARGSGGLSLLEAGYLVLIATLVLAMVSALVLVAVPLAALRRGADRFRIRWRVVVYFGALGLGFLLMEVAFLQQLILVLHHPVYSAAVVIASFLVFAGLGSAVAPRVEARWGRRTVPRVGGAILAVGLMDLVLLATLSPALAGAAMAVRVAFAVMLVAPLALLMGMPFPLGLGALKKADDHLVPWAWAINGCASVVAPILATLVAVHHGFRVVVLAALIAYGVAAVSRLEGSKV